jgi:hypothetical protein
MTRRFKFILILAVLIGLLVGFIPSEKVQAYWLTNYVGETEGLGPKWDRSGYNDHAYWYRQYVGVYDPSQSSWWSDYHGTAMYHYWSAYIPSYLYTSKAVVSYGISLYRSVTVNQNSYNNAWAYLGSNDTQQYQSSVLLSNSCVAGYTCNGLEVIWDDARYQYWVD